ncbi:MAG: hypothetical protein KAT58_01140 [candidate division Zixibacteria bacterium]|nr:hypothetical protein [candidate division Zixibacteria bacterium]
MFRYPVTAITFVALSLLVFSCSNESKEIRSDNTEIARLLIDDAKARIIFPTPAIDTTNRSLIYAKRTGVADYINPLDYYVEFISQARGFIITDSCAADTLVTGDPCESVPLETGERAKAKVVRIHDTLQCRYHIIQRSDSTVVVSKDVRLIGVSWVLMAQLGISEAHYNGWSIYGVGRQRLAENYAGQVPVVDSIIIRPYSGDFVYYPSAKVDYIPLKLLPTVGKSETFTVYVYTSPRTGGGELFRDVYFHQYRYSEGTFIHEWGAVSSTGRFNFEVTENSGHSSGSYSQVVVELFTFGSLHDDTETLFGTYLFAITYKIK